MCPPCSIKIRDFLHTNMRAPRDLFRTRCNTNTSWTMAHLVPLAKVPHFPEFPPSCQDFPNNIFPTNKMSVHLKARHFAVPPQKAHLPRPPPPPLSSTPISPPESNRLSPFPKLQQKVPHSTKRIFSPSPSKTGSSKRNSSTTPSMAKNCGDSNYSSWVLFL